MKDIRLVLTLLGIAFLGNLARAAVSPEGAGLALTLQQRHPGVRWGGGLAAALASALCNFGLLDPEANQDANIGLGLYVTFGWIPVLGGAARLGGWLGRLAFPHAPLPPPLPPLSWRGWDKPLMLPLLGAAVNLWAEWRRGQAQPFLTWWWVTLGLLTLAQVWWTSAGKL